MPAAAPPSVPSTEVLRYTPVMFRSLWPKSCCATETAAPRAMRSLRVDVVARVDHLAGGLDHVGAGAPALDVPVERGPTPTAYLWR